MFCVLGSAAVGWQHVKAQLDAAGIGLVPEAPSEITAS
jgi:hypothetical protein